MTTAGPNSPATVNQIIFNGSSITWTNPTNAEVSDNVFTTSQAANGGIRTNWLEPQNYGFTIPSGAIINGVTVAVQIKADTLTPVPTVWAILLLKAGTMVGNDLGGTPILLTDSFLTFGGPTNLWGTTWTASDINASNFGVSFHCANGGSGTSIISCDYVSITVDYTGGNTNHFLSCLGAGS